ncbi:uncharacterized protein LOC122500168 [Leptopilina heterotoma]|uniref:uncharacterized protein LOC122500168 n=1 Tax=Leptopilina heterotoma TaxID=63436 RepID=UPI001CA85608|nr:uncharacterized protein LOC122500168 [Leptopilina heterotoma]
MGSARPQDKSLGGGISLPQWMKGKFDNKYDFDDSAFSPPSHDDNFFFIRLSKNPVTENASGFTNISNVINSNQETSKVPSVQTSAPNFKDVKQIDFSKHPEPCQPFVPSASNKGQTYKIPKTVLANNIKPKSQGTDDGFHGTPALCGKSIVHVANQMMSSKLNKTNSTSDFRTENADNPFPKGSKSLPATPLASPMSTPDSSPKSRRRTHGNRFFTGAFVPDREKYQGSWILAGILGQPREIVTSKIDEEEEISHENMPGRVLSRKKSISSQNLTYVGKDEKSPEKQSVASVFQAKPSELREMNFWSPTSM